MAIAIDIPHTPIVSVQKSYNRSMTTENNIIRLNSKAWNDFTAALNEPMGLRLNELLERDPIWT